MKLIRLLRYPLVICAKKTMIPLGMLHSSLHWRKAGSRPVIQILLYHRVQDQVQKEIAVTRRNFLWQMEYLLRKGYQVISLEEALHLKADGPPLSRKRQRYAVLTFDDGYLDFYTDVFPILQRYEFPAALYLVSGYVETSKVFWWDQDLGKSELMGWNQLKQIVASGLITIGSHTTHHPDLDTIGQRELQRQLKRSRMILEEQLKVPVRHFSYPRGIVTEEARAVAKSLYDSAVSIFDGYELSERVSDKRDDVIYQIKRLPVQRSDGRLLFAARLRGWLVGEEWFKNRMRRRRER